MNNYQNIDFNDTNLYIGIDVHKKNWEVAIRCNGIQLKRFNMEASDKHLAAFLNKTYPKANFIAVYEAGFWDSGFAGSFVIWELVAPRLIRPMYLPHNKKRLIRMTVLMPVNCPVNLRKIPCRKSMCLIPFTNNCVL